MTAADRTARALDRIPTLELPVGAFVETNSDGTVQIDFGQGAVTCLSAGSYEPLPGVPVRCISTDAGTVMIGPAKPVRSIGTVTATGATVLTVTIDGVPGYLLPFLASYTPRTVADVVLIDWASGGIVVGKPSAIPSSSYTPAGGTGESFSVDFRANDSGSYFSGSWWTTEVRCSTGNIGAWFYGSTIADTIPDSAVISRVQLYVNEFYNEFPSSLATIGLHSLATKAGAPSVVSAVTISAGTGWKDLPASFGDALKTGSRLGVGTNTGGNHRFRPIASDADCGLLRIDWSI